MTSHDYFLNLAYNEALKSNMNTQYGCVIVYRNTVISSGFNSITQNVNAYKECLLCG